MRPSRGPDAPRIHAHFDWAGTITRSLALVVGSLVVAGPRARRITTDAPGATGRLAIDVQLKGKQTVTQGVLDLPARLPRWNTCRAALARAPLSSGRSPTTRSQRDEHRLGPRSSSTRSTFILDVLSVAATTPARLATSSLARLPKSGRRTGLMAMGRPQSDCARK